MALKIEMEPPTTEIKRLKGCINDLLSVISIPAICSSHEPTHITSTLLEVLVTTLNADFVYGQVNYSSGCQPSTEVVQFASHLNTSAKARDIGQMLQPWLTDPGSSPLEIPDPVASGSTFIAQLRVELQSEILVLVAGSKRADFPTEIELLLLRVAANQAGIQLQQALLLNEQKRTADEIRFQAELLDAVDQAVVAIDMDGRIIYWNRFAEALYGWPAVEVKGRHFADVASIHGPRNEKAEMLSHWERGERWTGECLVKHRNGETLPVLVTDSPIYDGHEQLIGSVRVSIDISELKHAEEVLEQRVTERTRQLTDVNDELRKEIYDRERVEAELRESEQRFHNLADTAPVMIWMCGTDKLCTYVSQRWLEFTGRNIDEELGNGWVDRIHPDDYYGFLEYGRAFDARRTFRQKYRMKRHDGEYRWILDTGVPHFAPDGEFIGFIGSCLDITDRVESEVALEKALSEVQRLKDQLYAENIYLQEEIMVAHNFGEIIGRSESLQRALRQAEQVAPVDTTVLLLGETGTGKELLAHAIHSLHPRNQHPLVKVNCATLPAQLIESELFGHERGSFTGALARRVGRFEIANGGTIFLDEIGELPLDLQSKLLRVLQEGEFERVGSSNTIKVNVRVIAATNRNLEEAVRNGSFRSDLYYRLNIFPIRVPALRERREDIPTLVKHFVSQLGLKLGKRIDSIPQETMEALQNYDWPGNIRELRNVIERAAIVTQGNQLTLVDRLENQSQLKESSQSISTVPSRESETLDEHQKQLIIRTMEKTYWRVEGPVGAAALLGVHPNTLRSRMKRLGITKPKFKEPA